MIRKESVILHVEKRLYARGMRSRGIHESGDRLARMAHILLHIKDIATREMRFMNTTKQHDGRRKPCAGLTLVEVVLGITLLSLLLFSVISGVVVANGFSAVAAQNLAAFQHARSRIEMMRSTNFTAIATNVFTAETVNLGYAAGLTRTPITGYLTNMVTSYSSPERKVVDVTVAWQYRGRSRTQEVRGVIYYKR